MAVVNSKVEICNQALSACGASTISQLSDDSQEARLCNLHYIPVLYALLRRHNWNFAMKRKELTLSTNIVPGFASTFQLPDDFLKAVVVSNSRHPYKIMEDKLVTNFNAVTLEYVAQALDVSKYDALFVEAFSMALAARMIYKFNQSSNARQDIQGLAKGSLRDARSADGQEGTQYNM